MVATYSSNIRLTKQGTGDNNSTWGTVLNSEVIDLVDFAITGYTTISLAGGDVSLTANNGTTDQSRSAILELSGTMTGDADVYLPSGVSKVYIVNNNTSGAFEATILINGGTGHTVPQGGSAVVYTDGVTVTPTFDSTGLGFGTAATLNYGTSVNQLIPVSSADIRYVTTSAAQTVTGAKTFTSITTYNGGTIEASATQAYSKFVSVAVSTSSVEYDFSTGNNFSTILNANVTFNNPTNVQPGQTGIIYIQQDGTGSRTASFASNWKFPSGTGPTLSTAGSSIDALVYNVRTSTAISGFFTSNLS